MPDFETGIRTRLIDASTVAGGRVFWGLRSQDTTEPPQDRDAPSITLLIVSDPRPKHLKGREGARRTRVQADCRAKTYALAKQLAEQAIDALSEPATVDGKAFGGAMIEGPRDLPERQDTNTIHRRSVDFIIWHEGD